MLVILIIKILINETILQKINFSLYKCCDKLEVVTSKYEENNIFLKNFEHDRKVM